MRLIRGFLSMAIRQKARKLMLPPMRRRRTQNRPPLQISPWPGYETEPVSTVNFAPESS
jgi:hypothetical protein